MDGINEYDFNARRYNSALGSFTTWDPLAEKRPWDSPYAFCGGDPVNLSDPNGRDYQIDINVDQKEITVRAKYYVFAEDALSAQSALDFWNKQSGKFSYKEFKVNFDLKIKTVSLEDSPYKEGNNIEIQSLRYFIQMTKEEGVNSYIIQNELKENLNGTTNLGCMIYVLNSRKDTDTGAHEVGHSLGLIHSETGIMTATSTDPQRSQSVSQREINQCILGGLKGRPLSENRNKAGKGFLKIQNGFSSKLPKWLSKYYKK